MVKGNKSAEKLISKSSYKELPRKLSPARLSHANLSYAKLSHARLSHARLSHARLSHARLSHARLSHARLSHSKLSQAKLSLQPESISSVSSSSESSDSTQSTDSSDSYLKHFEYSVDEDVNIFNFLKQTDEPLEDDEDYDHIEAQPIEEEKGTFFQLFGDVPDLDDVSADISHRPPSIEMPIIYEYTPTKRDGGKFVNPLTGLELEYGGESASSRSQDEEVSSDKEEESKTSSRDSKASVSSELLVAAEDKFEETQVTKEDDMDEALAAFFETKREASIKEDEEIDWETLFKAEKAKALKSHALNFLNEVISKVVHDSEHLSPEKALERNLDKRKLIEELSLLYPNLQSTKNTCAILNRQVVRHFRRKKSFESIMEDSPHMVLQYKRKLASAKEHLDKAFAKENELMEVSKKLQAELNQQYEELKQETNNQIEIFENLVKKHLYREGFVRVKAEVNRFLLTMSKYRKEMSEARLYMLLQQATEGQLRAQIEKLDDLGNGLNMRGFITYQAENQTLIKKIEERNDDLDKMHTRCHHSVHVLAHFKENQHMFYNTLQIQRAAYDSVVHDKRLLRERLFALKLQRIRIHKKIRTLRIQGGILDNPDLMFDYDQTAKLVDQKKETVEVLRRTISATESKINQLIAHCQTGSM